MEQGRAVDLRHNSSLELLGSLFEKLPYTVEVRRINSQRTVGCYNIPSVGVFVWRLKPYSVTPTPACCVEAEDPHCFTFSVLANDAPIYVEPTPEPDPTHTAEELNLPDKYPSAKLEV